MSKHLLALTLSLVLTAAPSASALESFDCPGLAPEECQVIFSQANPNSANVLAFTPLTLAIKKGNLAEVKRLVEAGASVNATDANKISPLTIAVANRQLELFDYLLSKGGDVNARDKDGQTVLFALLSDSKDIKLMLERLLQAGADINAVDNQGNTLLMAAAGFGDVELVRLLLQKGARHNLVNKDGKDPLYLAVEGELYGSKYRGDEAYQIDFNTVVALLLAQGASSGIDTINAPSLLELAAQLEQPTSLFLLTAYDPRLTDLQPEIQKLLDTESMLLLESLLKHGLDRSARDSEQKTQLMAAAQYGHAELVRRLLALGADPALLNAQGQTALTLAINNNQQETVRLLLPHAKPEERLKAAVVLEDLAWLSEHFRNLPPDSADWVAVMGEAAYLGRLPVLVWAKAQGQNLALRDSQGNNLLSYALLGESTRSFAWLLEQGVSPHLPNTAGMTVAQQVEFFHAREFMPLIDAEDQAN